MRSVFFEKTLKLARTQLTWSRSRTKEVERDGDRDPLPKFQEDKRRAWRSDRKMSVAGHIFRKKKKNWKPDDDGPPKDYSRTPMSITTKLEDQLRWEAEVRAEIESTFYEHTTELVGTDEGAFPYNRHYLVIHFGAYARITNEEMMPAEFCIADFSVRDGILNMANQVTDPGDVPLGFASAFRDTIKERKYPYPPFDNGFDFGLHCIDVIQQFMDKYTPTRRQRPWYLFTIREEFTTVKLCLEYAFNQSGKKLNYKLMPFSVLLETLLAHADHLREINNYQQGSAGAIKEAAAISLIADHNYDYAIELGCDYHRMEPNQDGLNYCSMSVVKRWIYNALSALTRYFNCPRYLHNHVPERLSTEDLQVVGEQMQCTLAHETPDYELPRNVGVDQLYFYTSASASSDSKIKEGSNYCAPAGARFAVLPDDMNKPEKPKPYLGTYQFFPNLCEVKSILPKEERAMKVEVRPAGASAGQVKPSGSSAGKDKTSGSSTTDQDKPSGSSAFQGNPSWTSTDQYKPSGSSASQDNPSWTSTDQDGPSGSSSVQLASPEGTGDTNTTTSGTTTTGLGSPPVFPGPSTSSATPNITPVEPGVSKVVHPDTPFNTTVIAPKPADPLEPIEEDMSWIPAVKPPDYKNLPPVLKIAKRIEKLSRFLTPAELAGGHLLKRQMEMSLELQHGVKPNMIMPSGRTFMDTSELEPGACMSGMGRGIGPVAGISPFYRYPRNRPGVGRGQKVNPFLGVQYPGIDTLSQDQLDSMTKEELEQFAEEYAKKHGIEFKKDPPPPKKEDKPRKVSSGDRFESVSDIPEGETRPLRDWKGCAFQSSDGGGRI